MGNCIILMIYLWHYKHWMPKNEYFAFVYIAQFRVCRMTNVIWLFIRVSEWTSGKFQLTRFNAILFNNIELDSMDWRAKAHFAVWKFRLFALCTYSSESKPDTQLSLTWSISPRIRSPDYNKSHYYKNIIIYLNNIFFIVDYWPTRFT